MADLNRRNEIATGVSKPRTAKARTPEGERTEGSKWLTASVLYGLRFRTMHERIRLINHHGKKVLAVDLSNFSTAEVEKIVRAVPYFVTTLPLGSLRILSDF